MKILLDENFPLPLLRALRAEGLGADQIMTLCHESVSDREVRTRLDRERVLFLTQDVEYLTAEIPAEALVLVSRVALSRPLAERVAVWLSGVHALLNMTSTDRIFELTDAGDVISARSVSSATVV